MVKISGLKLAQLLNSILYDVEVQSTTSSIIISHKHIDLFIENDVFDETFIIIDADGEPVYCSDDHFEAARQFNLLCSE